MKIRVINLIVINLCIFLMVSMISACGSSGEITEDSPTAAVTATLMGLGGTWTTISDLPTGRWDHSVCVLDGKIYVIGGAGPIYEALGTVEVYDLATDTWAAKSEMPTPRQGLTTSVVNGKIYAIGGAVSASVRYSSVETFSTVEEYDPITDIWTEKSPMSTSRGFHSASVIDGKVYIIGGARGSTPDYNHVQTVEVYDPETDTWSQKEDMPVSRAAGSSSLVDGKIYLFGGYGGSNWVSEYDPLADTWTNMSKMPTKRTNLSTSVVDGKIYIIGGYIPGEPGYPGLTTVEVYDPVADTWETAPDMPSGRYGAYAGVMDGKVYVIGGMQNWRYENTLPADGIVEVFEP